MDAKFKEKLIAALTGEIAETYFTETAEERVRRIDALIEEEMGRVFLLCASIGRNERIESRSKIPIQERIVAKIAAAHLAWIYDSPIIPDPKAGEKLQFKDLTFIREESGFAHVRAHDYDFVVPIDSLTRVPIAVARKTS